MIKATDAADIISERFGTPLSELVDVFADVPAVDAVEVVRCRDCIHFGLYDCPMCYIEKRELIFINHDPAFYCGQGEREEESK